MKVCYVTHLPNLTGASQSLLDILSNLNREKVEAVVLLGKHGPLEQELEKINIRYKVIPYSSEIKEPGFNIKNLFKRIKSYFAVFRIKKFFVEEKFDIIHNNSLLVGVGMEAAYQLKIPYISHLRELIFEDHNIYLLNEKRQFELSNNANAVISISECVKNKFLNNIDEKKIQVLLDCINIEKYIIPKHEIFNQDKEEKKTVNVILPGRICTGKGQLDAIKAIHIIQKKIDDGKIKNIENINLYIVGGIKDNNYYNEMMRYIYEYKMSGVNIMEFSNDLKKLRSKCDIGLTCSVFEALGRVTIESMLSKLLVIGAKTGGTIEIVKEEMGLLYESGNLEDLAEKIIFAINNKEKMRKIASKGYEYAIKEFDPYVYNIKLYNIYKLILE